MIIPVRCVTCGTVIGDKYRCYLAEVVRRKREQNIPVDRVRYMTPQDSEKTIEGIVLDELKLTKMCCRRTMLTHVDI